MITRRRLAAALAAGVWSFACAGIASADYRKDPAVRAAVEEKLKTSDEAEIRKRWGSFADLVDKVWIYERSGSHTWFHLRWAVPGAVMEYSLGHCPGKKCGVRKAMLVHKPAPQPAPAAPAPAPESSGSFSLSDLTKSLSGLTSLLNLGGGQPAFEVLWEDGGEATGELVEGGHVKMDGYTYEHEAGKSEVNIRGIVYKAITPAQLVAMTGYVLGEKAATAATATAAKAPAIAPVAAKTTLRAGLLGVQLAAMDPAKPFASDVVLQAVQANGPAAAAGLAAGDIVQSIDGVERPRQGDLLRTIAASAGKTISIVVTRAGQPLARSVTLGESTVSGPCFVVGRAGAYQYDGECKDGFAHGRGEVSYTHENGTVVSRYAGEFAGGMPEGRGKLVYADGRPGFEGEFALGKPVGLKPFAEALFVCTRPDASGEYECDAPHRAGLKGSAAQPPAALVESLADACPSKRRLPSRTHLVWGCGFGATHAPGAADRGGEGIEVRGRGTYQCLEREPGCKRTEL